MNKDKIAGAVQETGGKIRQKVDHVFGDTKGEALGLKDQVAGKVRKTYGEAKDSLKD